MTTSRELGSLTLAAELANLEALQEYLAGCATQFGLEPRRIGMLTMALEEIFVNICSYAYPAGQGPVTLTCRDEGEHFIAEVSDEGQAFDITSVAEPDLKADIETRNIGGLGLFLVRKVVDQLDYFRQDGRNIVRLTLKR
ncbi:MAG: ATP-binding protein [Thiohalomonadaceae bacterium]